MHKTAATCRSHSACAQTVCGVICRGANAVDDVPSSASRSLTPGGCWRCCGTPWAFPRESQRVSHSGGFTHTHTRCVCVYIESFTIGTQTCQTCESDSGGQRALCAENEEGSAPASDARRTKLCRCFLSHSLLFLFPSAEVQGRHARLQQCLHTHHQCNHHQPRPPVDGAAHRHHLHVQPVHPLPPVRPPPPEQRPRAAGPQRAHPSRRHPLHRGRQGPSQEGRTGEGFSDNNEERVEIPRV